MGEFAEVIRQFDRMCKASPGCIKCPLNTPPSAADKCSIAVFVSVPDMIEQKIMAWAAEHPEPVYPTWALWLCEQGIATVVPSFSDKRDYDASLNDIAYQPIPADIAQKLGIEPKEGNNG